MALELGILGAVLLVLAWTWETVEAVRRHKSLMDLKFAVLCLFGNALLVAYALSIGDPVFVILNIAILVVIIAEIAYSLMIRKVHR